jgi:hypothetical protein
MTHRYKEPRVCECGYSTSIRGSWSLHKRIKCVEHDKENDLLKQQLSDARD